MFSSERELNKTLIKLTAGFSYQDSINYRKDRNWQKYDTSNSSEKLLMIIKEVKEYKNGYFDEDDLFGYENNNNDNYY